MDLDKAQEIAQRVVDHLTPVVDHICIAGSIRRLKPEVKDIELVIKPRTSQETLFPSALVDVHGEEPGPDISVIYDKLNEISHFDKWGHKYMRTSKVFGEDIALDAFIVTPPAQWGSIYAIRTGPASFAKKCMIRLLERGLRHVNGHVEHKETGQVIPTETETAFLSLCGIDYLPPWKRE